MDIPQLRVFNVIHKLKLTEKQFEDIETEQNNNEHTGIAIVTLLPKCSIYVNHDDKHKIIIGKKIKGTKAKQRLLFKCLIDMWDLPKQIYDLHTICRYYRFDSDMKYKVKTLSELKDRICDRFVDGYPKTLGEIDRTDYGYDSEATERYKKEKEEKIKKHLDALDWLFKNKENKKYKVRPNIEKIIKVYQRNNRRVAIFFKLEEYDKQNGGMYCSGIRHIKNNVIKIQTFKPNDERFNYVCPGREIYRGYSKEIWLDDGMDCIKDSELEIIKERMQSNWFLLTKKNYGGLKSSIRLKIMSEERNKEDDKAKENLKEQLKKQFEKGDVSRSGIVFNKNYLICNGITVKGKHLGEFIFREHVLFRDEPDFADIINNYTDFILTNVIIDSDFSIKESLIVDKVKVIIEKRGKNCYVNNNKIKLSDLSQSVKHAITLKNTKECNKYLEIRSRVNLELQEHLDDGAISIEFTTNKTKDNIFSERTSMVVGLEIKRENNKNYIKIKNEWYKVKDMPSLMNAKNSCKNPNYRDNEGELQRVIKLLYKSIDGLIAKDVGEIIKNGEKEYTRLKKERDRIKAEKFKQSSKFLAHAIKITKATINKGNYFVTGKSGTHYVLEGLKAHIITDKTKTYLCLIDFKNRDEEHEKIEGIAKRLLMLSNDSDIASEVFERGDKMDTHWAEI